MDTQLIALTVIALVGFGVMIISFDSEVTGQGVKIITLPKETLQKVVEKDSIPEGTPVLFTLGECTIYREIYYLRVELGLKTDRLEDVRTMCQKYYKMYF